MTTFEIIGLIAAGVFVVAFLAIALPRTVVYFIKGPLAARISSVYRPDEVLIKDLTENSFGLESAGVSRPRGKGGIGTHRAVPALFYVSSETRGSYSPYRGF